MKISIQVQCERCGHSRFDDMPACDCVAGQGPFTTNYSIFPVEKQEGVMA